MTWKYVLLEKIKHIRKKMLLVCRKFDLFDKVTEVIFDHLSLIISLGVTRVDK